MSFDDLRATTYRTDGKDGEEIPDAGQVSTTDPDNPEHGVLFVLQQDGRLLIHMHAEKPDHMGFTHYILGLDTCQELRGLLGHGP